MSQTQSDLPPTRSDDDPLAALHKMSTTAGLGSGDYVAVNGTAVFAILLGLASALALMNELLLIIPLAGVVVAIVAMRQIAHSNGTQTGKGLVVLGLVLMIGFGGSVAMQRIVRNIRTREDRQAISELIRQLGEDAKAGQFDAAYGLFSSRFHEVWKLQDFLDRIKYFRESNVWGKLRGANPGLMEFQTDDATGTQFAVARVFLDFEKLEKPLPDELSFRKEGDQWRIEAFSTLFPPPARKQPG